MMKWFAFSLCMLGLAGWLSPLGQGQDLSVEELLNNLKTEHYSGKPIDLQLEETTVETLFSHFEKFSGISFELSSKISTQSLGKKDYNFKQVPWDQIMSFVLIEYGLEAIPKDGVVYIRPKKDNLMRLIREDQVQTPGFSRIPPLFYFLTILVLIGGGAGFLLYRKKIKTRDTSSRGFAIDPDKADEVMKKVTYMFDVEKAYRKEDISLHSLSEELSIPSHQLSWVINKKMNITFSGLVNSYRVAEVKKRLTSSEDTDKTILDIAFDAGFNTKTSFNRVFKKLTRMTPSQYRQHFKAPN